MKKIYRQKFIFHLLLLFVVAVVGAAASATH